MKKTTYLLLAAAAVGAGCQKGDDSGKYVPQAETKVAAASVAPGQEATLYPLAVGNRWRYKVTRDTYVGGQKSTTVEEILMEVKSVEDIPDGKRGIVEITKNEDVTVDRQIWEVTSKGISQVSIGMEQKQAFEPPQVTLVFPLDANKTWAYKGKGPTPFGKIGTISSDSKWSGPVEVTTENQVISAYQVDTSSKYTVPGSGEAADEVQMFWAPNVGLVRYRQTLLASAQAKDATGKTQNVGIGNQVIMSLIEKKP